MTAQNPKPSFPRQSARTQRFTLGAPRAFTPSPDGERVMFLRSARGNGRSQAMWVLDVATGEERIAADPNTLLAGAEEELSAEERARRERTREGSAGIVGYATDQAAELAAFALSGRLFVVELRVGTARELDVPGPVIDPRPSPDGQFVAYVCGGALRVVRADGTGDRALAEPDGDQFGYGLAEFIAAEEMGRVRGFWWSPDSSRLLAARVDQTPVRRWWISDPANPGQAPAEVAYPAAGTANADVHLVLLEVADGGSRTAATWDRERYPYLARVLWQGRAPLLLAQSRDQREQVYLSVEPGSGLTTGVLIETDEKWLELFPGSPALTSDGDLIRISDESGSRHIVWGGRALSGPESHVRAILDVGNRDILFSASSADGAEDTANAGNTGNAEGAGKTEKTETTQNSGKAGKIRDIGKTEEIGEVGKPREVGEIHVYLAAVDSGGVVRVSSEPGVHSAVRSGPLTVLISSSLDRPGPSVRVLRDGEVVGEIASYAETPVVVARPVLTEAGGRRIPAAVLLPTGYRDADGPLPVLMDPYGGPHGQSVLAAQRSHLQAQWLADRGFAVVVADGRGTPGRSVAWEKAVAHDFAGVTLDDQVEALHALADRFPLDLGRVGIRGWSYGGYLAALAVLRRPDVFHAAVAGAPPTDWRLYDTHYTERYLGHPEERPAVYAANSLVTEEGLSAAAALARPLMIIHGLADDNVVAAHTLRLSSALLAAGRAHEVLPLSGVTHMTPQERVAENLLLLQVDFLKRSLGMA